MSVCDRVCVTCEWNDSWPTYLACRFILPLFVYGSKVKVITKFTAREWEICSFAYGCTWQNKVFLVIWPVCYNGRCHLQWGFSSWQCVLRRIVVRCFKAQQHLTSVRLSCRLLRSSLFRFRLKITRSKSWAIKICHLIFDYNSHISWWIFTLFLPKKTVKYSLQFC